MEPLITIYVVLFLFSIFMVVANWKLFEKAGQPGVLAIIPILNIYIMFKLADMSGWAILGLFVPILNVVLVLVMNVKLAENFEKDALFGLGLFMFGFIFLPVLAFGDSEYIGTF